MKNVDSTAEREYIFAYRDDVIYVADKVTNFRFSSNQFVYTLHINFDYSLLQPNTILNTHSLTVEPRDEYTNQFIS